MSPFRHLKTETDKVSETLCFVVIYNSGRRTKSTNTVTVVTTNSGKITKYKLFSNIEILKRFQPKALRMIVDAPLYVPNTVIRRDLQIPTVKEEIRRYSSPQRTSKLPNSKTH
jgi:hypothetical protein